MTDKNSNKNAEARSDKKIAALKAKIAELEAANHELKCELDSHAKYAEEGRVAYDKQDVAHQIMMLGATVKQMATSLDHMGQPYANGPVAAKAQFLMHHCSLLIRILQDEDAKRGIKPNASLTGQRPMPTKPGTYDVADVLPLEIGQAIRNIMPYVAEAKDRALKKHCDGQYMTAANVNEAVRKALGNMVEAGDILQKTARGDRHDIPLTRKQFMLTDLSDDGNVWNELTVNDDADAPDIDDAVVDTVVSSVMDQVGNFIDDIVDGVTDSFTDALAAGSEEVVSKATGRKPESKSPKRTSTSKSSKSSKSSKQPKRTGDRSNSMADVARDLATKGI